MYTSTCRSDARGHKRTSSDLAACRGSYIDEVVCCPPGRASSATTDKFVVIDIETTGLFAEDETAPPPDILCVATAMTTNGTDVDVIESVQIDSKTARTWPEDSSDIPAQAMTPAQILELVDYLWCAHLQGMRLLAWNGVGYDFRVLWMHCHRMCTPQSIVAAERVRTMTLKCCDPMLNFTFRKGFPIKLAAAAAMLLPPMSKTGDGADCAQNWLQGTNQDRADVLAYCTNDVLMTCAVFSHAVTTGGLTWRTQGGTSRCWKPASGPQELTATCEEVSRWNFADNDWMRKKNETGRTLPTADQFVGWLLLSNSR